MAGIRSNQVKPGHVWPVVGHVWRVVGRGREQGGQKSEIGGQNWFLSRPLISHLCPENKKAEIRADADKNPLPSLSLGCSDASSELWLGDIEMGYNLPRVLNSDNLGFVAMSRPDS